MPLIDRKTAILAKIETTYGTDAVPTGAANAILVGNVKLSPLEGGTVQRSNVQPYLGSRPAVQVNTSVKLGFAVELAGSGSAGTAPAYGALLRACGLSETLTASTKAEYRPISTAFESVSIYFSKDGQQHKLLGARGSVSLKFDAGTVPTMEFSFVGLYQAPTSQADPAVTLTAFQIPLPCSKANTPTFSLYSYAAALSVLGLDVGNNVVYRGLVGAESVQIADRNAKGKATIEAPALSAKDFFALAKAGTTGALQIVHGTVAGNIVQLDAAAVQATNPGYGAEDGIVMLDLDLGYLPVSGNDEFTLTIK